MSAGAVLFLGAFGCILCIVLWRVTTLQTGPEGHTLLDSFTDLASATAARGILEGAGIDVILEDHRPSWVFRSSALPPGSVNLFVRDADASRAAHLLKEAAAKAHQHGPTVA